MKRLIITISSFVVLLSISNFSNANSVDSTSKQEVKAQKMKGEVISLTSHRKKDNDYSIVTPLGNFDPLKDEEPLVPLKLLANKSESGNGQFIVQFGDNDPKVAINLVERAGGEVYGYYNNAAIKVKLPVSASASLKSNAAIRAIVPVHPAYKIDKSLNYATEDVSGAVYEDTNGTINIAVLIWKSESKKKIVEIIEASGGNLLTSVDEFTTLLEANIPSQLVNNLAEHEDVVYIQRAREKKTALDETHTITQVNLSPWTYGYSGFGETIAIVDTGIEATHTSFQNRITASVAYGNPSATTDTNGHGTHVAGIASGNGVSSSNNNKRGFAYDATILNQAYIGCTSCPSLSQLYLDGWNQGARVSNNSWVYDDETAGRYDAYASELDSIIKNRVEGPGIPNRSTYNIIFSSGNNGVLASPNSAKNIISVGTSYNTKTGNANQLPSWSGGGATEDGRQKKPDLVAPGASVVSTKSANSSYPDYQGNSFYTLLGGTSMAAPQVSGAAAILRELYDYVDVPFPTASLIKAQLINGAVSLSDSKAGWGRLNVNNSLGQGDGWFYSDDLSIFEGAAYQFINTVTNSNSPLKVTLAWIDPPGDPANASTDVTVNDLDLVLISPSGTQYSSSTSKETVEQIVVNNPEIGDWRVQVQGYDVFLSQAFSLVSTYK